MKKSKIIQPSDFHRINDSRTIALINYLGGGVKLNEAILFSPDIKRLIIWLKDVYKYLEQNNGKK